MFNGVIYDNGTVSLAVGGFTLDGYTMGSYALREPSYKSDHIEFNTGGYNVCGSVNPIDFTDYSSLEVEIIGDGKTSTNRLGVMICNDTGKDFGSLLFQAGFTDTATKHKETIDISTVSGKHYFGFEHYGATTTDYAYLYSAKLIK